MSKRDELIAYVASLTPEQVDKVCKHLDLLKMEAAMSENGLVFIKRFLKRIEGVA